MNIKFDNCDLCAAVFGLNQNLHCLNRLLLRHYSKSATAIILPRTNSSCHCNVRRVQKSTARVTSMFQTEFHRSTLGFEFGALHSRTFTLREPKASLGNNHHTCPYLNINLNIFSQGFLFSPAPTVLIYHPIYLHWYFLKLFGIWPSKIIGRENLRLTSWSSP